MTAEVLPAIRRDGSYSLFAPDRADLEAKRAYYRDLPEAHRNRADVRAEALHQIEELIANGSPVGAAIRAVAAEMGLCERTLYSYRRAVYMVPRSDWNAAMAPRWSGPRAMLAEFHPDAKALFVRLSASTARDSDVIRRLVDAAEENGWEPIPSPRTLRRLRARLLPKPSSKEAA